MNVISWGKREKFTFSSCGGLREWAPPTVPALFAVTYQRDPNNKPKGHTVLYFGAADDMARQAGLIKRQMSEIWADENGRPEDLFVFVKAMDGSTVQERSRILERLVLEYQPKANKLIG